MLRRLGLLACLLLGPLLASAQPVQDGGPYARVALRLDDPALFAQLAEVGIALDHVRVVKDGSGERMAHVVLNAWEQERLAEAGVTYRVEVPDLQAAYAARPNPPVNLRAMKAGGEVPDGFDLGSMGGFLTLDEAVAELDELRTAYPELVTEKVRIGTSWEGRPLWMVKMSAHPEVDEDEPEVLYTALHHAREPASLTTLVYFMHLLAEGYGTDPEITYLLDHRELFFVPIVNPDGYVYNQTTDPNGGGMWRKNRRVNTDGSHGVDLNRNYGFAWGYDNSGSSPYPTSETYRGPEAFSEPETQAIRDFVVGRDFRLALNYHTYGDLLIYPWSYEGSFLTPDSTVFSEYALAMTRDNGYQIGTANETVGYLTNGDSDDWMYGEQDVKPKILAMTPEVGDYGFWPGQQSIVPLAQENVLTNLLLAHYAGGFVTPGAASWTDAGDPAKTAANGFVDPGETGFVFVEVRNAGQGDAENVSVRLVSEDPYVTVLDDGFTEPLTIPARDASSASGLLVSVSEDAPVGYEPALLLEIDRDGFVLRQPVEGLTVGTEEVFFSDAADDLDVWSPGSWGTVTGDYVSAPSAFADSPAGAYGDEQENALTLTTPFDLSETSGPALRFQTKWDIESRYDFAQVEASTNGSTWVPLEGTRTIAGSGSGVQTTGEPGYDGAQTTWVEEIMDLSDYEGESEVYLRFVLRTDYSVTEDGWFVDDVEVISYTDGSTSVEAEDEQAPHAVSLLPPSPNPSSGATTVTFTLPETQHVDLAVFDVLGREVARLAAAPFSAGAHRVTWDADSLAGGVYVVRLRLEDGSIQTQRVVLAR